jgi:hypothetical protein
VSESQSQADYVAMLIPLLLLFELLICWQCLLLCVCMCFCWLQHI